jgi:YggT family protein
MAEMNIVLSLFQIAIMLLSVLWWIIIVQAILSWLVAFNVLNTSSGGVRAFVAALDRLTAPLYRPIRRFMPDMGGIDFSPLVVLLLIMVLQKLLAGAAMDIATTAV